MTKEALELALEALQDYVDEYGPWSDDSGAQYVLRVGKEALAQPEQEPVAWLQICLAPLHEGDVIARTTKPTKWNPEWWRFEPLYTTPPQRTWVGLSDEERQEIALEIPIDAVSITEAKLRSKNTRGKE